MRALQIPLSTWKQTAAQSAEMPSFPVAFKKKEQEEEEKKKKKKKRKRREKKKRKSMQPDTPLGNEHYQAIELRSFASPRQARTDHADPETCALTLPTCCLLLPCASDVCTQQGDREAAAGAAAAQCGRALQRGCAPRVERCRSCRALLLPHRYQPFWSTTDRKSVV